MGVVRLGNKVNVRSIQTMLRDLADSIDQGTDDFETVFVIGVRNADDPPEVMEFGKEQPRLVAFGAMHSALEQLSQTEDA